MRAAAPPMALVVEDEVLIRADIVEKFRQCGWVVVTSSSGEEALKLASQHRVDVVVTDIQLSGNLQGWDLAERLRETERLCDAQRRVPIVYASGNAPDLTRQVAGSLFFHKPYSSYDVVQACQKLVSTV